MLAAIDWAQGLKNDDLVHRSEHLANPPTPVKVLFGVLARQELQTILAASPRTGRLSGRTNRRLSPADVDQLVAHYASGIRSIYKLAEIYQIHRNTVALYL